MNRGGCLARILTPYDGCYECHIEDLFFIAIHYSRNLKQLQDVLKIFANQVNNTKFSIDCFGRHTPYTIIKKIKNKNGNSNIRIVNRLIEELNGRGQEGDEMMYIANYMRDRVLQIKSIEGY